MRADDVTFRQIKTNVVARGQVLTPAGNTTRQATFEQFLFISFCFFCLGPRACASRKSRSVRTNKGYPSFIILADGSFSYGIPRNLAFDPAAACRPAAREPGSAPPNRCASKVRRKTPEVNLRRPPLVDLSLPSLARLAIGGMFLDL